VFSTAHISNTTTNLYVNAVGADRPGIVSDMTKFVTDAGGNVGQSQAAKLGDHFSLMMQIQVPTDQVETLRTQLQNMPGMNASIFETNTPETTTTLTPNIACK
jgi:glycine cleavage system transcriptional repressor